MHRKLLFLLFIFHQLMNFCCSEDGTNNEDILRAAELSGVLEYGDDCSWEAEQYRQNYLPRLIKTPGNSNALSKLDTEIANTILEQNYRMCAESQLLVCDKKSKKCVCGDAYYEATIGVNRSLYTLGRNNKCGWRANAYCMPIYGTFSEYQLDEVIPKCAAGTTCRFQNGDLCMRQSVMEHLIKKFGLDKLDEEVIKNELMSGSMCTCQSDRDEL